MPQTLFARRSPLRALRRRRRARVERGANSLLGPLLVAVSLGAGGWVASQPAHRPVAPAPSAATAALPPARFSLALQARVERVLDAPRASRSRRTPAGPVVHRPAWTRPSAGAITSGFGRRWGRRHEGVDLGAHYGAPIYAAADGVITYAGPKGGYGRLILIDHGGGVVTAYGHMSRYARTGGRVRAGDVIAYVGSAGDATGPHLHFEVRLHGAPIDPVPWLREHGVRLSY